jgi:hypothetical protein
VSELGEPVVNLLALGKKQGDSPLGECVGLFDCG